MHEGMYTRNQSRSREKENPGESDKKRRYAKKLKNETTQAKAMREKIRTGRADTRQTVAEIRKTEKLHRQGRKKTFKGRDTSKAIRRVEAVIEKPGEENREDGNVSSEVMSAGSRITEEGVSRLKTAGTRRGKKSRYSSKKNPDKTARSGRNGYSGKLRSSIYTQKAKEHRQFEEPYEISGPEYAGTEFAEPEYTGSNPASRSMQKKRMKREIQRQAGEEQRRESVNAAGAFSRRFIDKAEDMTGKAVKAVKDLITEHPMAVVIAGCVLIAAMILSGMLSSCSMMAENAGNMLITTSFTAQDSDILAVEGEYVTLEEALRERMDGIETEYPGYDAYEVTSCELSHNPYELAALLTVLYEDYTPGEAAGILQSILDLQYSLTTEERVEVRTDPETGDEREIRILHITLTNNGIGAAADALGLSPEQMERYRILLQMRGNKPQLFGDNPYANPGAESAYESYAVPGEYLTDVQFGNLLHEAEKYLGYPYVWGGSNPSTSFDCSGFVSYVINNCGNGWNYGRLTAEGWKNATARVPEGDVRPGDLIFFQGTYHTSGASHVGIVVDPANRIMIHCGNPIQYASYDSNYWRAHFYCFGRLGG